MKQQKLAHAYVFLLPFLIGFPLIYMYFNWVSARYYAVNFFLTVDKALEVSLLPPMAIYGLCAFVFFATLSWLKADWKWLSGLLRFRALLLPLALCFLLWYLKLPIQNKYQQKSNLQQQLSSMQPPAFPSSDTL